MDMKITTVNLPERTVERLDHWAERLQRSRSWLVNQAIGFYLLDQERLAEHEEIVNRCLTDTALRKAGKR